MQHSIRTILKNRFLLFLICFVLFTKIPAIAQTVITNSLSFTFTGDIMLGTDYPSKEFLPPKSRNFLLEIKKYLTNSVFTAGNLEGSICSHSAKARKSGKNSYSFRTPLALAGYLKDAGFNILNLANNHSFDFGQTGFTETTDFLTERNIGFCGIKDQVHISTAGELKVAWAGFSPYNRHNNINDIPSAQKLIKSLRNTADIIVVSFHGGAEGEDALDVPGKTEYFYNENRGDVQNFARSCIDAGADIIWGHGPHVLRAMEIYRERIIMYSLGNFCGYRRFKVQGAAGLSVIARITVLEDGTFSGGTLIPLLLRPLGIPVFDDSHAAIQLIKDLSSRNYPSSPLIIGEDGSLKKNSEYHHTD